MTTDTFGKLPPIPEGYKMAEVYSVFLASLIEEYADDPDELDILPAKFTAFIEHQGHLQAADPCAHINFVTEQRALYDAIIWTFKDDSKLTAGWDCEAPEDSTIDRFCIAVLPPDAFIKEKYFIDTEGEPHAIH